MLMNTKALVLLSLVAVTVALAAPAPRVFLFFRIGVHVSEVCYFSSAEHHRTPESVGEPQRRYQERLLGDILVLLASYW